MTTAAYALRRSVARPFPRFERKQLRPSTLILGVVILGAAVLYLVQVNGLATKGYVIQDLERSAYELRERNRSLEAQVLHLQSFRQVSTRVDALEMVHPQRVDYVNPSQGVAAR